MDNLKEDNLYDEFPKQSCFEEFQDDEINNKNNINISNFDDDHENYNSDSKH